MSLQFVIDGYNVVKHPLLSSLTRTKDPKIALVDLIKKNGLCGSINNQITIVFDGYANNPHINDLVNDMRLVFSCEDKADDKIKRMVESFENPRNIIVVSSDNEIRNFVKSCGAGVLTVEEFLQRPKKKQKALSGDLSYKPDLNYSQMHKINAELRKKWLK